MEKLWATNIIIIRHKQLKLEHGIPIESEIVLPAITLILQLDATTIRKSMWYS